VNAEYPSSNRARTTWWRWSAVIGTAAFLHVGWVVFYLWYIDFNLRLDFDPCYSDCHPHRPWHSVLSRLIPIIGVTAAGGLPALAFGVPRSSTRNWAVVSLLGCAPIALLVLLGALWLLYPM
jgi:hypothetical protein